MYQYVEYIIETIRNSFNDSVKVYTTGKCYQFYLILKAIFPGATAYYNSDHVITKIRSRYYDITGEVKKTNHLLVDDQLYSQKELDRIYDMS